VTLHPGDSAQTQTKVGPLQDGTYIGISDQSWCAWQIPFNTVGSGDSFPILTKIKGFEPLGYWAPEYVGMMPLGPNVSPGIDYFDGITFHRAGKDGCCRTPIRIWNNAITFQGIQTCPPSQTCPKGKGNKILWEFNPYSGPMPKNPGKTPYLAVNSLENSYAGQCWPHPGLWDRITEIENGVIPFGEDGQTWQPCQRLPYYYKDGIWRSLTDLAIEDRPCDIVKEQVLTEIQKTDPTKGLYYQNCCTDFLSSYYLEGATAKDGSIGLNLVEGGVYYTKLEKIQPTVAFRANRDEMCHCGGNTRGRDVNGVPCGVNNCWVCPSYLLENGDIDTCFWKSPSDCNCNHTNSDFWYFEPTAGVSGATFQYCRCVFPIGCTTDPNCEAAVCTYNPRCCTMAWDEECRTLAKWLCNCGKPQCPCECRNHHALLWSADQYNPGGWTGGKTRGLDLLYNSEDCPQGVTCEDCKKCDLPLCMHKYNCNLKCPCGTYGMDCDKFCTDITGFYGEYDKELLSHGKVEWYNPGYGFSPCCGASGPVTKEDGNPAVCKDVCLNCDVETCTFGVCETNPGKCCSSVCAIPGYEYCCDKQWDQYCACKAKEKCCECPEFIQGPPIPTPQDCGVCPCNYYICDKHPGCTCSAEFHDCKNVAWSCFTGQHPYGIKDPYVGSTG